VPRRSLSRIAADREEHPTVKADWIPSSPVNRPPDEPQPVESLAEYFEDHIDADYPDFDDPPNRLHFDELHPLIRDAARESWSRRDYPKAVNDAWLALRDDIRQRTGRTDLDGVELINEGIGETNPKLPLTDCLTETDRNMHRGLVNFLRGIVFYVRHPEAHESVSPVAGDREGALERLSVMSLCARALEGTAPPTVLDDALSELTQPRFPRRRPDGYADLLRRVPERRHAELASRLLEAALKETDDDIFDSLARMYRYTIVQSPDESLASVSAVELGRLIADDNTLEVGTLLLTPNAASRLEDSYKWKVHELLLEQVKALPPSDGQSPSPLINAVVRLVPNMKQERRKEMLDAFADGIADNDHSRAIWTFVVVGRFLDRLPDDERLPLVAVIAQRAREDTRFAKFLDRGTGNARTPISQRVRDEIERARQGTDSELPRLLTSLEEEDAGQS
jgi:uncharacterized protein (TIGR02391 family)